MAAAARCPNTITRAVKLASWALCLALAVRVLHTQLVGSSQSPAVDSTVQRFPLRSGGAQLDRATHAGTFFDVVGRRSAIFGYENRSFEAWIYPLKFFDDFSLSFRLEGYPLDINGSDIMSSIRVRPESTTIAYAHAAFTVRQIMFAPLDEAGVVILLDVDSVLPVSITASFRPRLRLMWPATSMTGSLAWDADAHVYALTEETGRYAGVIGCPSARDVSMMPYQEEPRDIPNRFVIDATADTLRQQGIPVGESGDRQRARSQPAAWHGSRRRLPLVWRERASRLRVVLRPRRDVDGAGDQRRRRFRDDAERARVPSEVSTAGRKDSARDFAVGVDRVVVRSVRVRVGERRRHAALRHRAC